MLTALRLKNFKNFTDVELKLGPFTVLLGANAVGKSNLRDAFRFLHGIGRSYTLAEIMGEKWSDSGERQWRGIRGGTRESCSDLTKGFEFSVDFSLANPKLKRPQRARYHILVSIEPSNGQPVLSREKLNVGFGEAIFDSHPGVGDPLEQNEPNHLAVRLKKIGSQRKIGGKLLLLDMKSALCQIIEHRKLEDQDIKDEARRSLDVFESMRFLDLNPDAMRQPSIPGQTVLGDRGENLSSVLQAICADTDKKVTLLDWLRELTPMDATDFEFTPDAAGRILVMLVESSGRKISALSASDGTLRFLAMIAALIGPNPAKFYFFEEIDNGIHPTRLKLLVELIETQVKKTGIQVVTTTHSPDLLALLSPESLKNASLIYRLPGHGEARIKPILDIPTAKEVLEKQDIRRLLASGWFEDALAFTDDEPAP
ncbi:MAG: AAA family ATPase [Azospirillum sp.]|nr:AAA family ATPase [Azospirillum sp.]